MKNILAITLIIVGILGFTSAIFSQTPGNFDPNFAVGGELADSVIFPFKYSGMALSPGSEFVISSAIGNTIQAVRYSPYGLRDVTFGSNASGLIQIVPAGFSGSVTASLVQSDSRILIAGQYTITGHGDKAYLLRLNVDGSVDSTFGTNGWLFFNFLPHFGEYIHQIATQIDGKIVVLNMGNNPGNSDTLIVARINANGTFDNSFAANGLYQVPINNFLATSPNVFNVDLSDNLTFAGYSNFHSGDYIYLFRLDKNGLPDATYGNAGSIFIDSINIINGGSDLGLCFQKDGKLLTVQSKITGDILLAVCRYNTDGSVDQNFGSNGLVNVQPGLFPVPYAVQNIAVTSKDHIIIAGVVTEAGSNRAIVCSINRDGSPDVYFGNNQGSELLNCFQFDDIVYNLLIDPEDNILINGLVNEANSPSVDVVRLLGPSTTAGIKPLDRNIDFSVYPDPINNQVQFELSKPGAGEISISDVAGNVILVKQANNNPIQTLNMSNMAAGIYIVIYKDSETVVSKKVVKQ